MNRWLAHIVLAVAVLLGPLPSTSPEGSWVSAAFAKKKRKKRKRKKQLAQPVAEPTPSPAKEPATIDELLEQARTSYAGMDFLDVVPLADEVLAREGLTDEQRAEAHALRGRTHAILGKPEEAERDYRLLLGIRPDYELPGNTAPKILAAFRKVQDEERAIAEQERERARLRAIEQIHASTNVPGESEGGLPLIFNFQLEDPEQLVTTMKVHYRHQGNVPFSALALQVEPGGTWQGVLPAELTVNDDGLVIEYFLASAGTDGPLLELGSAAQPLSVHLTPGELPDHSSPLWESPWFWVAAAGVAAAAGVGGWLIYDQTTKLPDSRANLHLGD